MSAKLWAVYRTEGEYIESIQAVSGERALDVVAERHSIPLNELDAVDHDAMKCCGTCKWWIPQASRGGVCFGDDSTRQASEVCGAWTRYRATLEEEAVDAAAYLAQPDPIPDAGPTMRAVPWAQTEARVSAQRDPIPDAGPTDADMRGEVDHD